MGLTCPAAIVTLFLLELSSLYQDLPADLGTIPVENHELVVFQPYSQGSVIASNFDNVHILHVQEDPAYNPYFGLDGQSSMLNSKVYLNLSQTNTGTFLMAVNKQNQLQVETLFCVTYCIGNLSDPTMHDVCYDTINAGNLYSNTSASFLSQYIYEKNISFHTPVAYGLLQLEMTSGNKSNVTFLGGKYSDLFFVDHQGVLRTGRNITEQDVGSHTIEVGVLATVSGVSRVDWALITVNVVHAMPPAFEHPHGYTFSVKEEEGGGLSVGFVKALYFDLRMNGRISYSFTEPTIFFQINQTSGEIQTSVSLDRETVNRHMLTVAATDNGRAESLTSQVEVLVLVEDVNDNPPVFVEKEYSLSLSLYTQPGLLLRVNATDADVGQNAEVVYTITDGNANEMFRINSTSGELFLIAPLTVGVGDSIVLHVKADDKLPVNSLQASALVKITFVGVATTAAQEDPVALVSGVSVGGILLVGAIVLLSLHIWKKRRKRDWDRRRKQESLPMTCTRQKEPRYDEQFSTMRKTEKRWSSNLFHLMNNSGSCVNLEHIEMESWIPSPPQIPIHTSGSLSSESEFSMGRFKGSQVVVEVSATKPKAQYGLTSVVESQTPVYPEVSRYLRAVTSKSLPALQLPDTTFEKSKEQPIKQTTGQQISEVKSSPCIVGKKCLADGVRKTPSSLEDISEGACHKEILSTERTGTPVLVSSSDNSFKSSSNEDVPLHRYNTALVGSSSFQMMSQFSRSRSPDKESNSSLEDNVFSAESLKQAPVGSSSQFQPPTSRLQDDSRSLTGFEGSVDQDDTSVVASYPRNVLEGQNPVFPEGSRDLHTVTSKSLQALQPSDTTFENSKQQPIKQTTGQQISEVMPPPCIVEEKCLAAGVRKTPSSLEDISGGACHKEILSTEQTGAPVLVSSSNEDVPQSCYKTALVGSSSFQIMSQFSRSRSPDKESNSSLEDNDVSSASKGNLHEGELFPTLETREGTLVSGLDELESPSSSKEERSESSLHLFEDRPLPEGAKSVPNLLKRSQTGSLVDLISKSSLLLKAEVSQTLSSQVDPVVARAVMEQSCSQAALEHRELESESRATFSMKRSDSLSSFEDQLSSEGVKSAGTVSDRSQETSRSSMELKLHKLEAESPGTFSNQISDSLFLLKDQPPPERVKSGPTLSESTRETSSLNSLKKSGPLLTKEVSENLLSQVRSATVLTDRGHSYSQSSLGLGGLESESLSPFTKQTSQISSSSLYDQQSQARPKSASSSLRKPEIVSVGSALQSALCLAKKKSQNLLPHPKPEASILEKGRKSSECGEDLGESSLSSSKDGSDSLSSVEHRFLSEKAKASPQSLTGSLAQAGLTSLSILAPLLTMVPSERLLPRSQPERTPTEGEQKYSQERLVLGKVESELLSSEKKVSELSQPSTEGRLSPAGVKSATSSLTEAQLNVYHEGTVAETLIIPSESSELLGGRFEDKEPVSRSTSISLSSKVMSGGVQSDTLSRAESLKKAPVGTSSQSRPSPSHLQDETRSPSCYEGSMDQDDMSVAASYQKELVESQNLVFPEVSRGLSVTTSKSLKALQPLDTTFENSSEQPIKQTTGQQMKLESKSPSSSKEERSESLYLFEDRLLLEGATSVPNLLKGYQKGCSIELRSKSAPLLTAEISQSLSSHMEPVGARAGGEQCFSHAGRELGSESRATFSKKRTDSLPLLEDRLPPESVKSAPTLSERSQETSTLNSPSNSALLLTEEFSQSLCSQIWPAKVIAERGQSYSHSSLGQDGFESESISQLTMQRSQSSSSSLHDQRSQAALSSSRKLGISVSVDSALESSPCLAERQSQNFLPHPEPAASILEKQREFSECKEDVGESSPLWSKERSDRLSLLERRFLPGKAEASPQSLLGSLAQAGLTSLSMLAPLLTKVPSERLLLRSQTARKPGEGEQKDCQDSLILGEVETESPSSGKQVFGSSLSSHEGRLSSVIAKSKPSSLTDVQVKTDDGGKITETMTLPSDFVEQISGRFESEKHVSRPFGESASLSAPQRDDSERPPPRSSAEDSSSNEDVTLSSHTTVLLGSTSVRVPTQFFHIESSDKESSSSLENNEGEGEQKDSQDSLILGEVETESPSTGKQVFGRSLSSHEGRLSSVIAKSKPSSLTDVQVKTDDGGKITETMTLPSDFVEQISGRFESEKHVSRPFGESASSDVTTPAGNVDFGSLQSDAQSKYLIQASVGTLSQRTLATSHLAGESRSAQDCLGRVNLSEMEYKSFDTSYPKHVLESQKQVFSQVSLDPRSVTPISLPALKFPNKSSSETEIKQSVGKRIVQVKSCPCIVEDYARETPSQMMGVRDDQNYEELPARDNSVTAVNSRSLDDSFTSSSNEDVPISSYKTALTGPSSFQIPHQFFPIETSDKESTSSFEDNEFSSASEGDLRDNESCTIVKTHENIHVETFPEVLKSAERLIHLKTVDSHQTVMLPAFTVQQAEDLSKLPLEETRRPSLSAPQRDDSERPPPRSSAEDSSSNEDVTLSSHTTVLLGSTSVRVPTQFFHIESSDKESSSSLENNEFSSSGEDNLRDNESCPMLETLEKLHVERSHEVLKVAGRLDHHKTLDSYQSHVLPTLTVEQTEDISRLTVADTARPSFSVPRKNDPEKALFSSSSDISFTSSSSEDVPIRSYRTALSDPLWFQIPSHFFQIESSDKESSCSFEDNEFLSASEGSLTPKPPSIIVGRSDGDLDNFTEEWESESSLLREASTDELGTLKSSMVGARTSSSQPSTTEQIVMKPSVESTIYTPTPMSESDISVSYPDVRSSLNTSSWPRKHEGIQQASVEESNDSSYKASLDDPWWCKTPPHFFRSRSPDKESRSYSEVTAFSSADEDDSPHKESFPKRYIQENVQKEMVIPVMKTDDEPLLPVAIMDASAVEEPGLASPNESQFAAGSSSHSFLDVDFLQQPKEADFNDSISAELYGVEKRDRTLTEVPSSMISPDLSPRTVSKVPPQRSRISKVGRKFKKLFKIGKSKNRHNELQKLEPEGDSSDFDSKTEEPPTSSHRGTGHPTSHSSVSTLRDNWPFLEVAVETTESSILQSKVIAPSGQGSISSDVASSSANLYASAIETERPAPVQSSRPRDRGIFTTDDAATTQRVNEMISTIVKNARAALECKLKDEISECPCSLSDAVTTQRINEMINTIVNNARAALKYKLKDAEMSLCEQSMKSSSESSLLATEPFLSPNAKDSLSIITEISQGNLQCTLQDISRRPSSETSFSPFLVENRETAGQESSCSLLDTATTQRINEMINTIVSHARGALQYQ